MANKSERRKEQAARRIARKQAQHNPGGASKYGRKEAYLKAHGGWGWEYPEPKPWK